MPKPKIKFRVPKSMSELRSLSNNELRLLHESLELAIVTVRMEVRMRVAQQQTLNKLKRR